MKDYIDRVLEEVTTETSEALVAVDTDIEARSAAIRFEALCNLFMLLDCLRCLLDLFRNLRKQIEDERRAQEALLKKMKQNEDPSYSSNADKASSNAAQRNGGRERVSYGGNSGRR